MLSVEQRDPGEPRIGMSWVDVTRPGLRPAMEISGLDPMRSWTERGTWRGIVAELRLDYEPTAGGCRVSATFTISGRGVLRPLGPVLAVAGSGAIASDLKAAARLLSERGSEQ